MPIKKPKRKKRSNKLTRTRYLDTQKSEPALELLNSRALMSLSNYLDYKVTEDAHHSMEKLFRDYKKHKREVHKALLSAFTYLLKERYIPDPDDPPYYTLPKGPPPSKEVVKEAKKHINRIAKKIWKKK